MTFTICRASALAVFIGLSLASGCTPAAEESPAAVAPPAVTATPPPGVNISQFQAQGQQRAKQNEAQMDKRIEVQSATESPK